MPEFVEKIDISGEFQNLVVTSGIVQKSILENASLLESGLVAYSIYHTQSSTQKAIVISRKWLLSSLCWVMTGEIP